MSKYLAQWSYDKKKWFSLDSDAIKPPTLFDSREAAQKALDELTTYFEPLGASIRVIKEEKQDE